MPIRPENRARYPKDWKTVIVPRIRARSGNRCECTGQCGVIHLDENEKAADGNNRCRRFNGEPIEMGVAKPFIVLTVMHLNHNPEDNGTPGNRPNLLHGCQGCHNRYDAPVRAAGIKARRKAERASGDLFKCEEAS